MTTPIQSKDLETQLQQKMSEILSPTGENILDPAGLAGHAVDPRWVTALIAYGLTVQEVEWIMPWQSRQSGDDSHRPLTDEESARLIQIARVLFLAVIVLRSQEKAIIWLRKPRREYGGLSLLSLSKSKSGALHVEELLRQVDSSNAEDS